MKGHHKGIWTTFCGQCFVNLRLFPFNLMNCQVILIELVEATCCKSNLCCVDLIQLESQNMYKIVHANYFGLPKGRYSLAEYLHSYIFNLLNCLVILVELVETTCCKSNLCTGDLIQLELQKMQCEIIHASCQSAKRKTQFGRIITYL